MLHVGALPHALHFLLERTCRDMTLVERMVAAGMSQDCAAETAMWYMAQGDDEGLETYVIALEAMKEMDTRRELHLVERK